MIAEPRLPAGFPPDGNPRRSMPYVDIEASTYSAVGQANGAWRVRSIRPKRRRFLLHPGLDIATGVKA
jgi:hypothetical protein